MKEGQASKPEETKTCKKSPLISRETGKRKETCVRQGPYTLRGCVRGREVSEDSPTPARLLQCPRLAGTAT